MENKPQNVKVAIRVRPVQEGDNRTGIPGWSGGVVNVTDATNRVGLSDDGVPTVHIYDHNTPYSYDHVFDEEATQRDLFVTLVEPLCRQAVEGYNASLFAYGQTGSGKTHTIQGPRQCDDENKGLLPRAVEYVFNTIGPVNTGDPSVQSYLAATSPTGNSRRRKAGLSSTWSPTTDIHLEPPIDGYRVHCSYYEIYQEQVYDLFNSDPSNPLPVREDVDHGVYAEGLRIVEVASAHETLYLYRRGEEARRVQATRMNTNSSRSHAIFNMHIKWSGTDPVTEAPITRESIFSLVDLAGSERQKQAGTTGDRFRETTKINGSLSVFSKVINALSKGGGHFVHYRDSKLTYLLKDCIGGNSKTQIIATVSPTLTGVHETISTLKFAQRAKLVRSTARVNMISADNIHDLRKENKRLRQQLHDLELSINTLPSSMLPSPNMSPDVSPVVSHIISPTISRGADDGVRVSPEESAVLKEAVARLEAAVIFESKAHDVECFWLRQQLERAKTAKPTKQLERSDTGGTDLRVGEDVGRVRPRADTPLDLGTVRRTNSKASQIATPIRVCTRGVAPPKPEMPVFRATSTEDLGGPLRMPSSRRSSMGEATIDEAAQTEIKLLRLQVCHLKGMCRALRGHLKYKEALESLPEAMLQSSPPDPTLTAAVTFVHQQNSLVAFLESKLDSQSIATSVDDSDCSSRRDSFAEPPSLEDYGSRDYSGFDPSLSALSPIQHIRHQHISSPLIPFDRPSSFTVLPSGL